MKNNNRINPKGLKGRDALNRMIKLMGEVVNEDIKTSVVELTKVAPNGVVYGIVRENHEYYIKTTNKKTKLVTEDFNYIGGLKNKKSEAYPTYAKAIKQLNLKFLSINESFGGDRVNVFKNDNLLIENAVAGGSMGFVGEIEDNNGSTIEDKDTSGDNLDGDFDENPTKSSTNSGKHKEGESGHDSHIIDEDVELTDDEEAIDRMISGEEVVEESIDYLTNNRLKIGRAISIVENKDKLNDLVESLNQNEILELQKVLKKKV